MHIIHRASFTTVSWKNGGGVTHEALRVPAGAAAFSWRVSIAEIDTAGPFSEFAGYHRTLVLLRGPGVRLRFGDGTHAILRQVGDLRQFDGGLATDCELLGGPCADLNLMVSTSMPPVDAWVATLREPQECCAGTRTTLVFGIDTAVAVQRDGAAAIRLEPWDLLVCPPGDAVTLSQAQEGDAPLVFLALLDDNSR